MGARCCFAFAMLLTLLIAIIFLVMAIVIDATQVIPGVAGTHHQGLCYLKNCTVRLIDCKEQNCAPKAGCQTTLYPCFILTTALVLTEGNDTYTGHFSEQTKELSPSFCKQSNATCYYNAANIATSLSLTGLSLEYGVTPLTILICFGLSFVTISLVFNCCLLYHWRKSGYQTIQ